MKDRLKEARKARQFTLKQVADLIHVSESAVSKFEHGSTPSEQTIVLFCDKLQVNRSWLETGEGEMFVQHTDDAQAISARVAREYGSDPLLRAFMTTYLQLDEAKRDLLLEIAQGFTAALKDALIEGKPAPDLSEYVHSRGDALDAARANEPIVPESKAQSS